MNDMICDYCGKQLRILSTENTKEGFVAKVRCDHCKITYKLYIGKPTNLVIREDD